MVLCCERKMWASAEGGAPEVTLETSMGSFTVEVIFILFYFLNSFVLKPRYRIRVLTIFFFLGF